MTDTTPLLSASSPNLFSMIEVSGKKVTAQVTHEGYLKVQMFDGDKAISCKDYKVTAGAKVFTKEQVEVIKDSVVEIFKEMLEKNETDIKQVTINSLREVKVLSNNNKKIEFASDRSSSSPLSSSNQVSNRTVLAAAEKIMGIVEKCFPKASSLLSTPQSSTSSSTSRPKSKTPVTSPDSLRLHSSVGNVSKREKAKNRRPMVSSLSSERPASVESDRPLSLLPSPSLPSHQKSKSIVASLNPQGTFDTRKKSLQIILISRFAEMGTVYLVRLQKH